MPVTVKAKGNDSTDAMIRKFKRKVLAEDILVEVRRREFHETKAMKKKERLNEVRRKKFTERKQREALNPKK
jgi:ribosomal protein S21